MDSQAVNAAPEPFFDKLVMQIFGQLVHLRENQDMLRVRLSKLIDLPENIIPLEEPMPVSKSNTIPTIFERLELISMKLEQRNMAFAELIKKFEELVG